MTRPRIPVGEARELPEQEAMRALYETFGVVDEPDTEIMSPDLELAPTPEHDFADRVRRAFVETP